MHTQLQRFITALLMFSATQLATAKDQFPAWIFSVSMSCIARNSEHLQLNGPYGKMWRENTAAQSSSVEFKKLKYALSFTPKLSDSLCQSVMDIDENTKPADLEALYKSNENRIESLQDFLQVYSHSSHSDNALRTQSLISAAHGGDIAWAKMMLDQGGSIESMGWLGQNVLIESVYPSPHLDMVEFLVAKGANVNGKSRHGSSVLYYASLTKNQAVIDFLVSKGAVSVEAPRSVPSKP